MTRARRSIEDTWQFLESRGEAMPRDADGRPAVGSVMPSFDDEVVRFSYFRQSVEDEEYRDLSLPRTFFGRSLLLRTCFANTDLSESRMCWNDFEGCDFSEADLSGADLRASQFERCNFRGAVLRGADLRHIWFEECDFSGADLTDAIAWNRDFRGCVQDSLNADQQESIEWVEDDGPEPPGG